MIVLLVAAVLALLVGIAVVVALASSRNEKVPAGKGTIASSPRAPAAAVPAEPPYGIDRRPRPAGEEIDVLLPPRVGPFERKNVRLLGEPREAPIYADYAAGKAAVFVELGINGDARGAQQAVKTAKGETHAEFPENADLDLFVVGREPSFFKSLNDLGAFFAWTRGGYYFSVHAKRGEADLDAFVEAFPY
jgi:hypothetical protein